MDLSNETSFPAAVARAQLLYKDLMLATVVLKATFEIGRSGEVRAAAEQIPISEPDVDTPYGTLDGDFVPVKPACDLAVFGSAHACPAGSTASVLEVAVEVGAFARSLRVSGDRHWKRSVWGLEPSEPAPFASMPLSYDRAYGGAALHVGKVKAPYHDNPLGRGYVHLKEHVDGSPLPNVEEGDQLVTSWEDRPLPAGLASLPRHSALRGTRGMVVDFEAQTTKLRPEAFSFAHPRMSLPAYPSGERMTLRGMHPGGVLSFVLPPLSYHLEVKLGRSAHQLPLVPDTLCVFPGEERFFVVARRAFVYQYLRRRRRTIRIVAEQRADSPGLTSIRAQRCSPVQTVEIGPDAPHVMPLPFDMLLELNPLTDLFENLPLCPSG
jgi:hypothetical protein